VCVFCGNLQTPLDDQHTLLSVAGLSEFDLLVWTQHNHLRVIGVQDPCITLALEAIGNHLHVAEITASMLDEIRYFLIPLSGLLVT
jgi:hypothetical protein